MGKKITFLCFLLLKTIICFSQEEVEIDTSYQVNYEEGFKDSVIVIRKKIVVKEKVFVIDSNRKHRWAFDVSTSPVFFSPFNSATTFSSTEVESKNSLKVHTGNTLGVNLYHVGKKVDYRFGLQVSRHRMQLENSRIIHYQQIDTIMVPDTLDVYYTVTPEGDTIYHYIIEEREQERIQNQTTNDQRQAAVKYFYVEMLVQAGYKMHLKKKWSLSCYGGPLIGFYISGKGTLFNQKGEEQSIDEVIVASPVIHLQGSLQLNYHYGKKADLFVEPYFQKHLISVNKNATKLFNKDLAGLKAGVKIFL